VSARAWRLVPYCLWAVVVVVAAVIVLPQVPWSGDSAAPVVPQAPAAWLPPPSTTTDPGSTVEAQFNARAESEGWLVDIPLRSVDDTNITPAKYMATFCSRETDGELLAPGPLEKMRAQWQAHPPMITEGVQQFCPSLLPLLHQAQQQTGLGLSVNGRTAVPFDVPPGRYRARGPLDLCEWTRESGQVVLDERTLHPRTPVEVRVQVSDDFFYAMQCGVWDRIT
jgi:hypothetical protein